MQLYFLRHAIAQDRAPGLRDFDRELVPIGAEKTEKLAHRLDDYGVRPVVIYTSPLKRAVQTAQIISNFAGIHLEVFEDLGFGFGGRELQSLVDRHNEDEEIMLVGHEPSFSQTISYIIGGGNITMKKGGLARVDLYSQHPLHGTLVWLLSPKVF
ncbi:MAG TPA: histidine phosphatase family protein [Aggregatilineales bacterium]|nr:histidine phosphatase family protein [Aggregatilineales bacterium]